MNQPDLILARLERDGRGALVSVDDLVEALYGNSKMPNNPISVLSVALSTLRRRGITIETVTAYRLAPRRRSENPMGQPGK